MKEDQETKLFGKYTDIVMLLLTFILTTVVGGFLSDRFQQSAWERDQIVQRQREEMSRASAVFERMSALLDRRLYRLRTVLWDIKTKAPSAILSDHRRQYREVIAEWNESLNTTLSFVQRYFGQDQRAILEGEINEKFRGFHGKIDAYLNSNQDLDLEVLEQELNDFNPEVYQFNLSLLDQLEKGQVGSFRNSEGRK